jgi:hypothetical protein
MNPSSACTRSRWPVAVSVPLLARSCPGKPPENRLNSAGPGIRMLTTTIKPTSGSACVGGFDVVRNPIAARSVSSVVFHDRVVDKTLTGRHPRRCLPAADRQPTRRLTPRHDTQGVPR